MRIYTSTIKGLCDPFKAMSAPTSTLAENLIRKDRWVVGTGLLLICLLSWTYLLTGANTGMSANAMTTWQFPPPINAASMTTGWSTYYWLVMLSMWCVMMVAMMLPSAAPVVLLYARVYRQSQRRGQIDSPYIPTANFLFGYLLAWFGFSVVATTIQWLLEYSRMLDAMMMWSTTTTLSAIFLAFAGVYQFSTLKTVCLKHCRSPIEFISQRWRTGRSGATIMGIEHGAYCVGCCWLLMALLFVGGVMNLVWIAALASVVLLEKLTPSGRWISRGSGALLIATAGYLISA